MTDNIISDISYAPSGIVGNVKVPTTNDVAVARDKNVVEVGVYKGPSETDAGVQITFKCPFVAQRAYVAISQHYGSGRKNNGLLQQAVMEENVTPQLVTNIINRTFGKRHPVFCPR